MADATGTVELSVADSFSGPMKKAAQAVLEADAATGSLAKKFDLLKTATSAVTSTDGTFLDMMNKMSAAGADMEKVQEAINERIKVTNDSTKATSEVYQQVMGQYKEFSETVKSSMAGATDAVKKNDDAVKASTVTHTQFTHTGREFSRTATEISFGIGQLSQFMGEGVGTAKIFTEGIRTLGYTIQSIPLGPVAIAISVVSGAFAIGSAVYKEFNKDAIAAAEAQKKLNTELETLSHKNETVNLLARLMNMTQAEARTALTAAGANVMYAQALDQTTKAQQKLNEAEAVPLARGGGRAATAVSSINATRNATVDAARSAKDLADATYKQAAAQEVARQSSDNLLNSLKQLGQGTPIRQLENLGNMSVTSAEALMNMAQASTTTADTVTYLIQRIQDGNSELAALTAAGYGTSDAANKIRDSIAEATHELQVMGDSTAQAVELDHQIADAMRQAAEDAKNLKAALAAGAAENYAYAASLRAIGDAFNESMGSIAEQGAENEQNYQDRITEIDANAQDERDRHAAEAGGGGGGGGGGGNKAAENAKKLQELDYQRAQNLKRVLEDMRKSDEQYNKDVRNQTIATMRSLADLDFNTHDSLDKAKTVREKEEIERRALFERGKILEDFEQRMNDLRARKQEFNAEMVQRRALIEEEYKHKRQLDSQGVASGKAAGHAATKDWEGELEKRVAKQKAAALKMLEHEKDRLAKEATAAKTRYNKEIADAAARDAAIKVGIANRVAFYKEQLKTIADFFVDVHFSAGVDSGGYTPPVGHEENTGGVSAPTPTGAPGPAPAPGPGPIIAPHPGGPPEFQFGGKVPGPMGMPMSAILHGGEEVVKASTVKKLDQAVSGSPASVFINLGSNGFAEPLLREMIEKLKKSGIIERQVDVHLYREGGR